MCLSMAIYWAAFNSYWMATQMGIGSNLPSAGAAFVVFIIGMFAGMHSKIFAPLRWIAGISYPLYLLHIPIAWGLLYFFASLGFGMNWCAYLASVVVIGLAWVTHYTVELPSQKFGKKISQWWCPQKSLVVDKA
nr:hypothetical protein [Pseudomonas simiae]